MKINMKKITALLLGALLMSTTLFAQEGNISADPARNNNLMIGAGAINGLYIVVKSADKLQDTQTGYFASITSNEVKPLYYIKYEYKLGKHHILGMNFANSGIVVGGLVKDSFFFTDLGVLTQTQLDLTYRSRSFNVRYNYLFGTNESFQVYWGLGVGVRGNSFRVKTNNPNLNKLNNIPGLNIASIPTMGFESTLGFRGLIQEQLGWYAELGIAKSVFQAGISYRF
jgi:hypothetical protein